MKDKELFDTMTSNLEALLKEYEMLFAKLVALETLYEEALKQEAEAEKRKQIA